MSRSNPYLAELHAEILKLVRMPEFMIPTLLLPVMFYTMFAVLIPGSNEQAPYLLATFGVFAVMGPALFGFGAGVAQERERGWLTLKRAVPAPSASVIIAKTLATLLMASISLAAMYAVANFAAGVRFTPGIWMSLLAVHILSALPFVLLGLSLGFLFGANAAVAMANIVFMSMAILGGLWVPITVFPDVMTQIAQFLPSYHLAEIALTISGAPGDRLLAPHLGAVGLMTGALGVGAIIAWANQR